MSINDYKAIASREQQAELKEDLIERKASILSNTLHAADPAAYAKAVKPLLEEYETVIKEEMAFAKEALKKITPVPYKQYGDVEVPSLSLTTLQSLKVEGTESTDDDHYAWSMEKAKNYEGLTPEIINGLRTFASRKKAIRVKMEDGDVPAIYYGESKEVRNLPHQGMGGDTKVPPKAKVGGGAADDAFTNFLGQADICIQTRSQAIDKIASSGAMKNGFQGGTKGVGLGKSGYKGKRKEAENEIFGLTDDTPAPDRPIYGYLEHPDRATSRGSDIGGNYGSVQLILKPSVKSKATFTLGDSLDDKAINGRQSGSISNPPKMSDVAYSKVTTRSDGNGLTSHDHKVKYDTDQERTINYIEAQIHGGVSLGDIKEVRIEKGVQLSPKSLANLQKEGVIVREIPPPLRTYLGHAGETLTHTGIENDNEFWESQKKK